MGRAWWLGLLVVAFIGCGGAPEEEADSPTAPSQAGLHLALNAISPGVGQATGSPLAGPTPTPTPTPEPDDAEDPEDEDVAAEPTPEPTPDPDNCPGLGVTIGARCAGSTPDCGIPDSSKAPTVEMGSKVVLDASYYLDQPWNKVHAEDECYPGPIDHWRTDSSVYCREPTSNNHVITCGPFQEEGSYFFQACGAGLCEEIYVEVN